MVGLETGTISQAKKNGNHIMCCGKRQAARRIAARGLRSSTQRLHAPGDLALVVSSTPEPIYGCATGVQYPFSEDEQTLFMDVRDVDCLSKEEYSVL
jgi:hypothetical protein